MAGQYTRTEFETEEEALKAYFSLGITHEAIRNFLAEYHGIDWSLRTLRRRLSDLGLKRHQYSNCSPQSVEHAVRQEISESGGSVGYRQVWSNLRVKHHVIVSRSKVCTFIMSNSF
jgi:hypothetical protein